jgi:hypothetical protein
MKKRRTLKNLMGLENEFLLSLYTQSLLSHTKDLILADRLSKEILRRLEYYFVVKTLNKKSYENRVRKH